MLKGMSYRIRLPLNLVITALFTAIVIGLVVAWHTYQNVRIELVENGGRLSYAFASAVQPALLHDDVWQAYNILRGPQKDLNTLNATFIVLDEEKRIFASSNPKKLPVAVPLDEVDLDLSKALESYENILPERGVYKMNKLPGRLLIAAPITSEGIAIGSMLLVYPRNVFWPRFISIIQQGGFSIFLVLAVIIPFGWFWGSKMVTPLTKLTKCMSRMRNEDIEQIECSISIEESDDEIGRLSLSFRELLMGLREKKGLERQIVSNERLAAVGRLASGVAHEINNPLGGMLVAIDTLREHGTTDDHSERTMALLERGLRQIQDTVSALLVEVRRESHSLTAQDIEDTRTLISVEAENRNIKIVWNNGIAGSLPLPSTLVRQVVINILLNAIQFSPQGGRVNANFSTGSEALTAMIQNEGEEMDQETIDHLFEPYYSNREGGTGLGLWVTYQIVNKLGGEIKVTSRQHGTSFQVLFPFTGQKEASYAA